MFKDVVFSFTSLSQRLVKKIKNKKNPAGEFVEFSLSCLGIVLRHPITNAIAAVLLQCSSSCTLVTVLYLENPGTKTLVCHVILMLSLELHRQHQIMLSWICCMFD